MFASILKRKESEFEVLKKEKLLLEEENEKLELELKKVTNEKFDCQEKLQKEVKILQEKLGMQGYCYGTTNNTIGFTYSCYF